MVKLSDEQVRALAECDGAPLMVELPGSKRRYLIVDAEVHNAAVEAAEKQRVHESIMKGFDDIKSGFGRPVDVAFADVRKRLEEHIGAKP